MRVNPTALPPTIFETFPRVFRNHSPKSSFILTNTQSRKIMANTSSPDLSTYGIENTTISTAAGVSLSDTQKLLTGSILDLFAGRPSKRKLTLWADDAVFTDPLTIAEGRKQYEAQWYGLKAAFSDIQRLKGEVVSGGNPIEIELKTKYIVKGLGSEQVIASRVLVHTSPDGEKIVKVEDKWDGKLPEGAFAKAMRNLNSVTVPALVSVPNSVEEEEAAAQK